MITPKYVQTMAAYGKWQNDNIVGGASQLDDAERRRDRGAFFRSIHGTFNHLLWGDRIWMSRFTGVGKPQQPDIANSVHECESWDELVAARRDLDSRIIAWGDGLAQSDIDGDLSWQSSSAGREVRRPRPMLLVHFFNHQTHHRGQVHAMLTAAGIKTKATDIPFMPGLS